MYMLIVWNKYWCNNTKSIKRIGGGGDGGGGGEYSVKEALFNSRETA